MQGLIPGPQNYDLSLRHTFNGLSHLGTPVALSLFPLVSQYLLGLVCSVFPYKVEVVLFQDPVKMFPYGKLRENISCTGLNRT